MSGAVIFIPFYSQFHFSTQVQKTRKKSVCVLTFMKPRSELPPIYLKKFDFVGFFYEEAKNDKIGKSTPSSILFKGLDNL